MFSSARPAPGDPARTSPIANRAATEGSRRWIEDRLGQVSVSAPRAVTLSSDSGRFQATVTNNLDQPVTVALDAVSDDQLGIQGPQRVDVGAGKRAAVLLTARTDENGVAAPGSRVQGVRSKLAQKWYGHNVQKPTAAEIEEAHHHAAHEHQLESGLDHPADGHQFDGHSDHTVEEAPLRGGH